MSDIRNNKARTNKKETSYKQYKNMQYMEILENYLEYPNKNLKFKYTVNGNVESTNFISEEDKADGWTQQFTNSNKFSKFLQTNLHYLPENLWGRTTVFYQDGVVVGYKANDRNINYFVHSADTDEVTKQLFDAIKPKVNINIQLINELLFVFDDKEIESWITIRAKKIVEECLRVQASQQL
jgi:hypothetical protein